MTAARAVAACLLVLALAGCSRDPYTFDEARADLVDAGLTRAQADCVVDGLDGAFRARVLGTPRDATDEERAAARSVIRGCTEGEEQAG